MTESQEMKQAAIAILRESVPKMEEQLSNFDVRLTRYYNGLINHSGTELGDDNDWHCLYELLGAIKFLRLMRCYIHDIEKVHQVIRLREGQWRQQGRMWLYESGGLLLPGTGSSMAHYRWEDFQVFIWSAIYGIRAWIDTEVENDTRQKLDTERDGSNGTIEDLRRLCTDFTLYGPRKIDKTGISAYNACLFFMLADNNSEIFCTANASAQSKILFDRAKSLIHQLDPKEQRIRFTATEVNWKPGQIRSATLSALSAGGKTKDGLFAELCCADEYGSAAYVNGKSDMGALVSVVQSSMGPRREPLTVTTTTAGNITAGPFIDKLDGMKQELQRELSDAYRQMKNDDYRLLSPSDRWMSLILEPDEWERDEEYLLTSKTLRRKINPMLGRIVQHSFYDSEIIEARRDPQKKVETITKLLNVYQTGRITHWIKGDRIRPLQIDRRITDCRFQDGWRVFCGLDFSHGDDLFAMSFLAVNYTPSESMLGKFFADTIAWVLEDTLNKSPNRALYEQWIQQGWLYVCPGEVFDSMLAITQLATIVSEGIDIVAFGYDPAQSIQPINQLKAWLQTLFQGRQDASLKDMAQVIQQMVVAVSQTSMNQNPRIAELEHMILEVEPWLQFSMSPLWPWCFGNCACELSSSNLRRITKGGPQPSHKIDPVAALVDALYCFDAAEGHIQ